MDMAADTDVLRLLGRPFPPYSARPFRCEGCGGLWRVAGVWHPGGQAGALVVVRCDGCHSMRNGGAP